MLLEDLAQLVDGLVDEEERHEGVEDILRELGEVLDERRTLKRNNIINSSRSSQVCTYHRCVSKTRNPISTSRIHYLVLWL